MNKTIVTTLAAVAAFAVAPSAMATTFPVGSPNFTASPGPNGTFSANFGNSGIAAGAFTEGWARILAALAAAVPGGPA